MKVFNTAYNNIKAVELESLKYGLLWFKGSPCTLCDLSSSSTQSRVRRSERSRLQMLWNELCLPHPFPQNPYIEDLTPNVILFGR